MRCSTKQAGLTMIETVIAVAVTGVVLSGVAVGTMALQKSSLGAKHYAAGMNNGSRLVDYVTRDLRCATKVSRLVSGTATPFLKGQTLEVSDTNQLVVHIPDFYVSNVPDNSSGSDYKTPRHGRAQIPSASTYFSYNTVVEVFGVTRAPRYPGTVDVRYVRKARSSGDPTVCFFRQEYEGATLRLEEEIAEKAAAAILRLTAVEKHAFQVTADFASNWSGEAARAGARQFVTVKLHNTRRD